jgi:AcrR family transcriptional regulator
MNDQATEPDSKRRILDAARILFARTGYEGTSTRAIGAEAGLNIATIAYHVGSKRELYQQVLEEMDRQERTVLLGALPDALPEDPAARRGALLDVLDQYLAFCVANPEVPMLWMRRWLDEDGDLPDAETAYALPAYRQVEAAVGDQAESPHLVVRTLVWSIYGFCTGGVFDRDDRRTGPRDPAAVDAFRLHLHRMAEAMLKPLS